MLTEKEKHGISELLGRMTSKDLTSLAQTVTSRLIVPETTSEAVSAILLNTDKPGDLLRRRKIKKELLFKYLHAKKVTVDPSADKCVFITHVLQLWGSQHGAPGESLNLSAKMSIKCRNFSLTYSISSIKTGPVFHEIEEDSYPEAPAPSRNTSYSSLLSLDNNHPISSHGLRQVINAHIDTGSDTENSLEMEDEPIDASVPNCANCVTSGSSPSNAEAFEMACSFVRWFYPLINGSIDCDTDYGSQHFWNDANAHVILQAASNTSESSVVEDNGKLAAELLRDITRKHTVSYNPNISKDGVEGVIDAHGLAIVTACGTLHSGSRCCGTFHQQFGLLRDTSTGNNWKIKFTNATLVSKDAVPEIPRLSNSSMVTTLNSSSTASSAASSSPPSRESPSSNMAFS